MIELLNMLATTALGLFAGSLLTEALLLVPFFRSLNFADFNRLHEEFGPRLYRYYAPLTTIAVVLPLAAATATTLGHAGNSFLSWVTAGLGLVILSTYVLYFRRANLAFAEKRLDAAALTKELTRWAAVHNFRTTLAIAAFVASMLATSQDTHLP